MNLGDLTEKQFEFLREFVLLSEELGVGPTQLEIAERLHISVGSARSRIRYLLEKDYLARRGKHRGLVVTNKIGRFAQ